jgi:citrate lyase beta subunit
VIRQPVHTVYGGAHLFRADTTRKLGDLALRAMDEHAPDAAALARAVGLPDDLAGAVHARVAAKLRREPVEDLRIDFEDGYGARPGAEEDGHAAAAAREVARGVAAGSLPPFLGIRVKALDEEVRDRSLRTLDVFLSTLVAEAGPALPAGFVVTLPKVSMPEQVAALADVLTAHEGALGLAGGAIRIEIMVETPGALVGPDGGIALPRLVAAGRGRCDAAHFGAYDYTASLGITAAHQRLSHPACDFARHLMQVALAGTGVRLSDGATNVLPVPVHRPAPGGAPLSEVEVEENRRAVHAAWRLHYDHVRRALAQGYYQGWDLHPAQLPARYAAVYAFFLEGVDAAAARLRSFVERAARATLAGGVFDDAATGQGLLNFFLRAAAAGALTEEEAVARAGLSPEELRGRSFAAIAAGRRR